VVVNLLRWHLTHFWPHRSLAQSVPGVLELRMAAGRLEQGQLPWRS
jgi:hypothetical protein